MPESDERKDFEIGLAGAQEAVVEFEDTQNGFVGKIQHGLHVNPAMVPLIVLVASVILFGILVGQRFFSPFAMTLWSASGFFLLLL